MMTTLDALHLYARDGDPKAFEQLVRAHQGMVYAACLRQLHNRADVEDAVQETFLKLARSARTIRGNVAAWLHAAAVRTAIDLSRKRGVRRKHESAVALADESPDQRQWAEIQECLDQALLELTESDRQLIVEHFLNGQTQTELAHKRGVSNATINRQVKQSLELLRHKLNAKGMTASVMVLTSGLLTESSQAAVPAALTQTLIKIGLTGGGRRFDGRRRDGGNDGGRQDRRGYGGGRADCGRNGLGRHGWFFQREADADYRAGDHRSARCGRRGCHRRAG